MAGLGQRGQATTETMIMITFLTFAVWSFIQLAILMTTKEYVNYAAFAAARAGMVSEDASGPSLRERAAVKLVLDKVQWTPGNVLSLSLMTRTDWTVPGKTRHGVEIPYSFPFEFGAYAGGVTIRAFSPIVVQERIQEEGDNAS